MHFDTWQWAAAIFGALLIGLSKTGFSGAGILMVAIFAQILPARASTGIVLPLLISADVIAVATFRRHAVWRHLWGLLPWSCTGVILGYLWMRSQANNAHSDAEFKYLIAAILIVLSVIQLVRKIMSKRGPESTQPSTRSQPSGDGMHRQASVGYLALMGLSAGFTTMTANAAGPIMILYLMAAGLPKMEFVGTGAWYFLIVNLFKVPFSATQGLISPASLVFESPLLPAVILGAFSGRYLVSKINQDAFEIMALAFAVLGAVNLLLPHR